MGRGFGRTAGTPSSIPRTLMSSSTSGQCTPSPEPIRRQFARWSGVASDSRHDQASGTLIVRPSASSAMILSSVTRTWVTRHLYSTVEFQGS